MKFDYVIQNPPYKSDLHLDFLELGLSVLSDKGKMVIIEPATWLINVRKNGKASRYNRIKKKLKNIVNNVVIENLNKEFGTRLYVPFSIVSINKGEYFDQIKFSCCGETKYVDTLYDCNLVGDNKLIQSILKKVKKFGDMMENHTTIKPIKGDVYYTRYANIVGGCFCSAEGRTYTDATYAKHVTGEYNINYMTAGYHTQKNNEISNKPIEKNDVNGNLRIGEIAENVYGTKEELENWKHFIFNNKLPLFINMVVTIDQHNNSLKFLPWLVDRIYTDKEIYDMFGLSDDEIKLIDKTLYKYERRSPWFERYMIGGENVGDEKVIDYIKKYNSNVRER